MTAEDKLPPALLSRLVRYVPETGKLYWLPRTDEHFGGSWPRCMIWNSKHAGREALCCIGNHGYPTGRILDRQYLAHRVVWALVHGAWPEHEIDHLDGDRTNNRIANLRAVTRFDNMRNRKLNRHNQSGALGVYWAKHAGKWRAEIKAGDRRIHLGYFVDKAAAIQARKRAEPKLGFHPNHGRVV